MKSFKLLSVLTSALVLLLGSCQNQRPSFAHVEDGLFVSENYPSHFIGTNFWYGPILGS